MTEEIQNNKNNPQGLLIADRLLDSLDVVVAKITSGRFIAMTFDTVGYTAGVVICGFLAYKQIIDATTFISVLGTYGLLVQKTRENYFNMNVKDKPKGE